MQIQDQKVVLNGVMKQNCWNNLIFFKEVNLFVFHELQIVTLYKYA